MTEGTVSIEGQGFVRRRLGRGLSALLGGNSPADGLADSDDMAAVIPLRAERLPPIRIKSTSS